VDVRGRWSCERLDVRGRRSCERLDVRGRRSCERLDVRGRRSCERLDVRGRRSCERLDVRVGFAAPISFDCITHKGARCSRTLLHEQDARSLASSEDALLQASGGRGVTGVTLGHCKHDASLWRREVYLIIAAGFARRRWQVSIETKSRPAKRWPAKRDPDRRPHENAIKIDQTVEPARYASRDLSAEQLRRCELGPGQQERL
jgi:hypothetical protein